MKFKELPIGTKCFHLYRPQWGILTIVQIGFKNGVVTVQRKDGKRHYINSHYLAKIYRNKYKISGHFVRIHVEIDGDRYHAWCPAMKGLHVDGFTLESAINNAKDAATAYIQSCNKHGDIIPKGI